MKYIQALKEQGYNLKNLPTDIKKAVNLVLKSKDYNSKVEALDFITFNSIRNSQPVDERIEELHKLSLTDHSVEDNNGFNTPLSIEIAEEQFAENLEPVKAGTGMFVNGRELSIQEVIEETQKEIDELEKQELTLQVHKEIMAKTKVLQRFKIQAEINNLIEKQVKTRNNYEYDKLEKQIVKLKAELQTKFASGGHIATKDDNNKVRNWKVRFHLARGENFMNWKVENPKTNEVHFYKPDEVQIEMFNCKLTNSPTTAMKIFTGKMDKSPIAWVVCEKYKVSKKIDPVDADERLTYNPRTAPNWYDTDGDNVDNYVFEKLVTFGRGVYYETPDGKLFALGGMAEQEELPMFTHGGHISSSRIRVPNVRGGWTKEKIVKYFKEQGSDIAGTHTIAKYISEFDNWQQFKDHIYYHGTTNYIEKGLKPSMAFSERWAEQQGGGGYGDRYFGISLTKRKRTAEIFAGQSSGVTIYPVILKRDAKVIERTDLQDASDVEDIIVELYEQGVDAVWIGGGEEELVVVNPFAILLYKKGSEYHSVYGGFKSVPLTDEKIKEIYDNASKIWEDYSEAKSKTTSKEERDALINSVPRIQFETGGQTRKSGKDIYENDIFQIRIIGGEPNYYKRVNKEWKFLSPDEVAKLKVGTKHELEHSATIEAFKRRDIPNETIASFIAYDHIKEDLNYYHKLDKAIPEKMAKGKKIDTPVTYTYALTIRPFDIGTYPKENFVRFVEEEADNYKFGLLEYSAPLSDEDVSHYSLAPVSELLPYNEIVFDYYEGNLGQVFIERTKSNIPYAKVYLYDDPNEDYIEKKDLTGQEFLRNVKNGNYKILNPQPRLKDTDGETHLNKPKEQKTGYKTDRLRHAIENTLSSGIIAQGTPYSKYEDVDALRSKMLAILKEREGENTYSTPYSMEALIDLRSKAYEQLEQERGNKYTDLLYGSVGDYEYKIKPIKFENGKTAYSGEVYWNGTFVQLFPVVPDRTIVELKVAINKYIYGTTIRPDKQNKNRVWFNGNPLEVSNKVYDKVVAEQPTPAPTPEPTNQPTPEIQKEETKMENNQPTGSVSNWNEVPVRWKNVKAVRPITFNLNPYDKGLNSIVKEFLGDDALRPVMTAMNFGDSGVVSTDAHKLLHIHYKHSDFRGNYATANTMKALKGGRWTKAPKDLEDATEQIKDDKYPNWIAVIPRENPYVYEVDIMKLYQYLNVAINYANKTTYQVNFRYDKGRAIGFNGKFLMQSLEAMMKIQKCTKVYLHLSEPSRAMLVTYEKSITPTGNTFALCMPMMVRSQNGDLDERGKPLKITHIFGSADIDYNKYLYCYFDFEDSEIHNGDGSIADYKESYGDAEEMPLSLITMLDKFIKISKPRIPILENVCVDGNGIRVDSLDARIEVANDWGIPQGLYRIEKNAMVRNTLNGNLDDFPKLKSRVATNDPVFSMDAEVFKYYIIKAFGHSGDDDLRPVMKSILFQYDFDGYLQIVSTNGYSLFHANVTKYAKVFKKEKFKFPVAYVKELINFTKNIDSKEVKFYVDGDKNYRIDGGRLHFEAKLEDGTYPNWEAVTPIKYSNQLSFDIKDLFVCMNNEVAKTFAKTEDLKPNVTTIFNQDDKIFIGNFPKQPDEQVTSKEICTLKIKKETFSVDQSFNTSSSNYVLLMPQMRTNGNYFNFAVDHLNDAIATIGKERVIVNYSDLNRAYIFTSDNLDYKTSDVYKPEKAVTTPVKASPVKPIKEKMQPSSSSTNFKTDKYGRLEPNATQLKMKNTPVPEMAQSMKNQIEMLEKERNLKYEKKTLSNWGYRYISLRRKIYPDYRDIEKYFGKQLGSFNVGDIIGLTSRNSDDDRYVVLEKSKDKVYILPYAYAYPKVSESNPSNNGWELIEPKQNLLVGDVAKKQPAPTKVSVSKPVEKMLGTGQVSPASPYIKSLYELHAKYTTAKTEPERKKLAILINVELGQLKKLQNNKNVKSVSAWQKAIENAISSTELVLKSKPETPKDDTKELEQAIKGLEAYLKNFGSVKESSAFKEWGDLKVAIKGLKALLK